MKDERIFLDTWYIIALLNPRDAHHALAVRLLPRIRSARELIVSELVISEICDGLARSGRARAATFARSCLTDPKFTVVPVGRDLLKAAIDFYAVHEDKEWGLTDCASFLIMRERGLQLVATGDHHFLQAGFTLLMQED
jgi:predicted nucleic acid-binding protein